MNLIYTSVDIKKFIIHHVGNTAKQENLSLSNKEVAIEDHVVSTDLIDYSFGSFKDNEGYCFFHIENLMFNVIYSYVTEIFTKNETFLKNSQKIARHLFHCGNNLNVKGGDLLVILFNNCILDGFEIVDAIGLFKVENKNRFLKIETNKDAFEIESDQGININKLDKGCLIFNTEKEDGYIVSIVDNTNKGIEAQYWIDDFLHIRQRQDKYFNTENTLTAYKEFITKKLPEEYEISKADQADMLNRTIQFFKERDDFELEAFSNEVLHHHEYIDGFKNYKKQYEKERDIEIADNFTISEAAVKRQSRNYKSIIKLDKNFHIYVHGDRNMIEQGEDSKGKFYKIYFKEEN